MRFISWRMFDSIYWRGDGQLSRSSRAAVARSMHHEQQILASLMIYGLLVMSSNHIIMMNIQIESFIKRFMQILK